MILSLRLYFYSGEEIHPNLQHTQKQPFPKCNSSLYFVLLRLPNLYSGIRWKHSSKALICFSTWPTVDVRVDCKMLVITFTVAQLQPTSPDRFTPTHWDAPWSLPTGFSLTIANPFIRTFNHIYLLFFSIKKHIIYYNNGTIVVCMMILLTGVALTLGGETRGRADIMRAELPCGGRKRPFEKQDSVCRTD